jgi:hypothetical protein
MSERASGTFEVDLTPVAAPDEGPVFFGRMRIDKQFSGDLSGASEGLMLAVRTGIDGSAGYVAMEKVTGSLAGRTGTFVLQHDGLMHRGSPDLRVRIIPDSGTGDLSGISGSMSIEIEDGRHFYELEYDLPD